MTARRTLLAPGSEAAWARINREETEYRQRSSIALSMAERLQLGQRLSTQAVELLAAADRAGLGPRSAHPS